jgi:hypothetical protein
MGGITLTRREPTLVIPFWVRIATETSLSPGWLLIAFPAVLYPTYLLLEVLFGRGLAAAMDFGGDFEARMVLLWAAVLGYVVMVGTFVAQGTLRDLDALRQALAGGEAAYAHARLQLTRFNRRRLWIGGLIFLALFCLRGELAIGRWSSLLAGEWSLRSICIVAVGSAFFISVGWLTVYLIDSARVYSRIGEEGVAVDLLDLTPLSPLTHHGLRIVFFLTIIMAVGVVMGFLLPPEAPRRSSSILWILNFVWYAIVASAAFLLPLRGLRRHIRSRKAEELARIREEIRLDRELVAQRGPDSAGASGRLPGLMAYEKRIESVREWPFDAPTLARFFLYVAIPLGSWVGGALVERLLGAALD